MQTLRRWWRKLENDLAGRGLGTPPSVETSSEWEKALVEAAGMEVGACKLDRARQLLDSIERQCPENWRPCWVWLDLQQRLRARSITPHAGRLALLDLARSLSECDPVKPRALHLGAVAVLWEGKLDLAEDLLVQALRHDLGEVRRAWVLDSIGQVLLWQGAWIEARRVFDGVVATKRKLNDAVGTAITAGHRALLELGLGEAEAAAELCGWALNTLGERLPQRTRLRLTNMLVQAYLEMGAIEQADSAAAPLRDWVRTVDHPQLTGFAALALARLAMARCGNGEARTKPDTRARTEARTEASGWLEMAELHLTGEERDLVPYWRLSLGLQPYQPTRPPRRAPSRDECTEGRLRLALLHAKKADDPGDRREWLRWATGIATRVNQPLWSARVDAVYQDLDPVGWGQAVVQRFAGVDVEELDRTTLADVTVIFSDLVGFTSRSQVLSPHEVIDTVRSLFELTAPLLARHRVRPLQHLGDGLLSVAQGPDHESRGLAFAQDLAERASRVTRVRQALGEKLGLDVRAGVASGPVVLGRLGSLSKLEYLAIGRTTNLAARLQGAADPCQVICDRSGETRRGWVHDAEKVSLKGFAEPITVYRYRPTGEASDEMGLD